MYAIRRTDQGGGYVAEKGSSSAYTTKIQRARIYCSREEAERDRCPGNEVIVKVSDLVGWRP